jgi:hypothetical protein
MAIRPNSKTFWISLLSGGSAGSLSGAEIWADADGEGIWLLHYGPDVTNSAIFMQDSTDTRWLDAVIVERTPVIRSHAVDGTFDDVYTTRCYEGRNLGGTPYTEGSGALIFHTDGQDPNLFVRDPLYVPPGWNLIFTGNSDPLSFRATIGIREA